MGIKIAQELDPKGRRTIGVLTKCDMMKEISINDRLLPMLKNEGVRKVNFQHDFRAVINRTKQEEYQHVSLKEVRAKEEQWFGNNYSVLKHVIHRCGTHKLISDLISILANSIHKSIELITSQTRKFQFQIEEQLEKFPKKFTDFEKKRELRNMTKYYNDAYRNLFKSNYDVTLEYDGCKQIKPHIGNFGVESRYENYMLYNKDLKLKPTDKQAWKNGEKKQKAHELTADRMTQHLGDLCFEYFMEEELKDIHKEAYTFLQRKRDLTVRGSMLALDCIAYRFPNIKEKFEAIIMRVIEKNTDIVKDQFTNLINCKKYSYFTALKQYAQTFDYQYKAMMHNCDSQRKLTRTATKKEIEKEEKAMNHSDSSDSDSDIETDYSSDEVGFAIGDIRNRRQVQ